jgi:hypothetical protein
MDICGCGECEVCQELTKKLRDNLTPEQKDYDNYVTRLPDSYEPDDG